MTSKWKSIERHMGILLIVTFVSFLLYMISIYMNFISLKSLHSPIVSSFLISTFPSIICYLGSIILLVLKYKQGAFLIFFYSLYSFNSTSSTILVNGISSLLHTGSINDYLTLMKFVFTLSALTALCVTAYATYVVFLISKPYYDKYIDSRISS